MRACWCRGSVRRGEADARVLLCTKSQRGGEGRDMPIENRDSQNGTKRTNKAREEEQTTCLYGVVPRVREERNEGRDFDSGPAVNSCGRAWRALFGKKDGSGRRG